MPGQRKSLGSLVGAPDLAPAAPPARTDKPAKPAPKADAPGEGMTMRSWYMPKASADRLAAPCR